MATWRKEKKIEEEFEEDERESDNAMMVSKKKKNVQANNNHFCFTLSPISIFQNSSTSFKYHRVVTTYPCLIAR